MTTRQYLDYLMENKENLYKNVVCLKERYKVFKDTREEAMHKSYIIGYLYALVDNDVITERERQKLYIYITL